ncbi:MAG: hypothetical protein Q7S39_09490 [Ignavibacteria bacterium]|nr:hypothetical protein [Ignavibacteria bacterium]
MFRLFTTFVFIFLFTVSDIYPGWVAGRVFYRYIGGIPPQYLYSCNWGVPTSNYAGTIFLEGSQGVSSANINKNCSQTQYYFQKSYNITGYTLYAYAFRYISPGVYEEHAGTMTVTSNGGYQDFYLDNYDNITVQNLTAKTPSGPFGGPPDRIYLQWQISFSQSINRFYIERRVNGGTWS